MAKPQLVDLLRRIPSCSYRDKPILARIVTESYQNNFDMFPFEHGYAFNCSSEVVQKLYNTYLVGINVYHVCDWSNVPPNYVINYCDYLIKGYKDSPYLRNVMSRVPEKDWKWYSKISTPEIDDFTTKLCRGERTYIAGIGFDYDDYVLNYVKYCTKRGVDLKMFSEYIPLGYTAYKPVVAYYQLTGKHIKCRDMKTTTSIRRSDNNLANTLLSVYADKYGLSKLKPYLTSLSVNSRGNYDSYTTSEVYAICLFETLMETDLIEQAVSYPILRSLDRALLKKLMKLIAEDKDAMMYLDLGLSIEDLDAIVTENLKLVKKTQTYTSRFLWAKAGIL